MWQKKVGRFFVLLFLSIPLVAFVQTDADLFLFSKHYHGGSARFEAMGGAFGALGADISAVQINPAGMGRFSSTQYSFSPRLTDNNIVSEFKTKETSNNRRSFSLPSIGAVFTFDVSANNRGNLYTQIAFGMNRLDHYHTKTIIRGNQYPSLLEDFASQAKGVEPNALFGSFPFTTSLAWESYAIDYKESDTSYYAPYLNTGDMDMLREVERTGGINELFFSYSVNRLNKLYWGFSFNLRTYKNAESYLHRERLTVPDPDFDGFAYNYSLNTSGTGVNLKMGFIYLITDAIRIGAAWHSPTYISLKDKWEADMRTFFKVSPNQSVPYALLPVGDYQYRMNTPMRAVVSIAGIVGMKLVLSGDVEYVDYKTARLRSIYAAYSFSDANREARERLKPALNYRFGAEYNLYHRWFFRVGYSVYAGAYQRSQEVDQKADVAISGGLGLKFGGVSFDLAYVNRQIERYYYPFLGSAVATTHQRSTNIILTTTFRI